MRHLDRRATKMPSTLRTDEVEQLRRELVDDATNLSRRSAQKRAPVDLRFFADPQLVDNLRMLTNDRCAYCETPLGESNPGVVEHHRPRQFAENADRRTSQPHYTWLAYEWENLLWVCKSCHRQKANKFFVDGPRGPVGAPIDTLRDTEEALLLDPCVDWAWPHLAFEPSGRVSGSTRQGTGTINLLNLNRRGLVSDRRSAFADLLNWLEENLSEVRLRRHPDARERWNEFSFDDPFPFGAANTIALLVGLGLGSEITLAEAISHLRDMPSSDRQAHFEAILNPPHYAPSDDFPRQLSLGPSLRRVLPTVSEMPAARSPVNRISIRNFKALQDLDIVLPEVVGGDPEITPCMIILGENATGKSTVLEAVALGLLGTYFIAELDDLVGGQLTPYEVIFRPDPTDRNFVTREELSIEIGFRDLGDRSKVEARSGSPSFEGERKPSRIVMGYGPRRYFSTRRTRRLRAAPYRVRSLFDPLATIPNPSEWLVRCKQSDFDAVARALREILLLDPDDFFERDGGSVLIDTAAGRMRLEDMSVGYKSVIAMATDIMRELLLHFDNLEFASATVLIDEIETHLHPRWKMRIVGALRRALPNVQFIVTTHDPLCLRGVYDGEVFVLRRRKGDQAIEQLVDLPSVRGMRAEQILMSEFFGLGSTDPETDAKLAVYHDLNSRLDDLGDADRQRLYSLQEELEQNLVIGDSIQEQAVAEALKRVEAETRVEPQRLALPKRADIVETILGALRNPNFRPARIGADDSQPGAQTEED